MRGDETKEEVLEAWIRSDHEIDQILGKALGYPTYPDDWNAGDSVCTGDHVPASLAMEAAQRIRDLEQAIRILGLQRSVDYVIRREIHG